MKKSIVEINKKDQDTEGVLTILRNDDDDDNKSP